MSNVTLFMCHIFGCIEHYDIFHFFLLYQANISQIWLEDECCNQTWNLMNIALNIYKYDKLQTILKYNNLESNYKMKITIKITIHNVLLLLIRLQKFIFYLISFSCRIWLTWLNVGFNDVCSINSFLVVLGPCFINL